MKVKVLYFAMLKDAMGTGEEWVELAAGSTAEALRSRLDPAWTTSLAVAVNLNYGGWNKVLNDGDEVALIPPVAGG